MKNSVIIDLDLIFTFIRNALKIESSRCSDELFRKYFNLGAHHAETYLKNAFPARDYYIDEIELRINQYWINHIVVVHDDYFETDAEGWGRIFVIVLFSQSIDFKVGLL